MKGRSAILIACLLGLAVCASAALGKGASGVSAQGAPSTRRWWAATGGLRTNEDGGIMLMAMDKSRRVIMDQVTSTGNTGVTDTARSYDFDEFSWSDGTWEKNIAADNAFIAMVEGKDKFEWMKEPKQCRNDGAGSKVCKAREDDFWNMQWTTGTSSKPVDMSLWDGKPIVLYKGGTTELWFRTVQTSGTNQDWNFLVQAEDARVHHTESIDLGSTVVGAGAGGTPWFAGAATSDTTLNPGYGLFKQETASISVVASKATKNRFYVLAKFTGNVKFGKVKKGQMEEVKTIQADGTYINICSANDRYDVAAGMVGYYPRPAGTSGAVLTDTWCKKKGYFLMALDLKNGNLAWVQPIVTHPTTVPAAGTFADFVATGATPNLLFTASNYDDSVYLAGDLDHSIYIGQPEKFAKDAAKTLTAMTTQTFIYPVIKAGTTTTANTNDFESNCRFMVRITKDAVVGTPLVLYKDGSGDPVVNGITSGSIRAATGANSRVYARDYGTWTTLAADDKSTNIYLGGTWSASQNSYVASPQVGVLNSIDVSRFWLGSSEYTQNIIQTTSSVTAKYIYQQHYHFFAGFNGASMASGTSWATFLYSYGEALPAAPAVAMSTASSKGDSRYVTFVGSFKNQTWLSVDASKTLVADGGSASNQYLLMLDGSTGAYVDSSVLAPYSSGVGVPNLLAPPAWLVPPVAAGALAIKSLKSYEDRAFIYGLFGGAISFNYLDTTTKATTTVVSRDMSSSDYIVGTFAKSLPPGPRTDWVSLRLGLGLGLGMGLGLVIVCLVAWLVYKRRGRVATEGGKAMSA